MKIIATSSINIEGVPIIVNYSILYSPYGIFEINQDKIYQYLITEDSTEYKDSLIIDKSILLKKIVHTIPYPYIKEDVVEQHYNMGTFTIIVSDHTSFVGCIHDIIQYVNKHKAITRK